MTDLVVISLEAWDEVWRRNQYLISGLLELDPSLRVLFVEPPADPLHDLLNGRPAQGHRRSRPDAGDGRLFTYRPVKWLPRRLAPGTDDHLARRVVREAARLEMRHPLLWLNDPRTANLSIHTGWPTLYDVTDDWVAARRPDEEHRRLLAGENTLLRTAAEVVVCSPELLKRKAPQRADRPIEMIRNAVDVEAYRRPATRPIDLPAGRTAVYAGTVHADRFDVETCARAAEALRGVGSVVLVGPMLLGAADKSRLRKAGVVALGARPKDAVPGYLQHADVLIVPHLVTDFTESLDPIKLYEYQAVGKPVVSTSVSGFRDSGDDRIEVVSATQFPRAVARNAQLALQDRPASAAPDWSTRTREMQLVLRRLAEGSP